MSDTDKGASVGEALEYALGEPTTPLTAAEIREWCERERDALINWEVQFSDPAWTWLHKLELHANALDMGNSTIEELQGECTAWARQADGLNRSMEIYESRIRELIAANEGLDFLIEADASWYDDSMMLEWYDINATRHTSHGENIREAIAAARKEEEALS
jgi:hypothetical protein